LVGGTKVKVLIEEEKSSIQGTTAYQRGSDIKHDFLREVREGGDRKEGIRKAELKRRLRGRSIKGSGSK